MDSAFGDSFLFLINLAWKSRITLPVLVTAIFMVMDLRPRIDINIQTRQMADEMEDIDNNSDISDDGWETIFDSDDDDEIEESENSEDSNDFY